MKINTENYKEHKTFINQGKVGDAFYKSNYYQGV